MKVKKITGNIHLCLGFTSGIIVLFLGLTGCILAFQREIEIVTMPYQWVAEQNAPFLSPSQIEKKVAQALPGKHAHSITYGKHGDAAKIAYYSTDYYYIIFADPYTGKVLKVKDMNWDFFRIVLMGHFYLFLPPAIGKPIVASATLIFFVLLVTGFILWFPKNKAALKQRFSINWKAKWRRLNYDLHNVPGFYSLILASILAVTGLVWGFKWFADSFYWVTSGGEKKIEYYESLSDKKNKASETAFAPVDLVYNKMKSEYSDAELIEVHFPDSDSAAVGASANPDASTYYKADNRYFDQYTLNEISVKHVYGRYKDAQASTGRMLARMNYDIHVGAIAGLPGKILVFIASFVASSLPVTGFIIWLGRKKKSSKKSMKVSKKAAKALI